MDLETKRLRGRPRNRWQDEVREDGRIVGGEGWKERVYNRDEWKKLLRTARNRRILHMAMEWMNEYSNVNEISYFKHIANCISKRLLSCSLKMALQRSRNMSLI
jgi:hypothetical protein